MSSDPFHAVVWTLLSIGIIGNILVVVWRVTANRDQRSSSVSILVIMLAVSDFLYCVHLLLLESLVADVDLDQTKHLSYISADNMCMTSACLSWFSCLTAQWATFNIAVYSFQAMSEFCSRCCCSLVRKRIVVITIICQVLINIAVISVYVIDKEDFSSDYDYLFDLSLQDYDKDTIDYLHINIINNVEHTETYNGTEFSSYSRRERIAEIFGRCALTQTNGYGYCYSSSRSFTHDNQTTIYNSSECTITSYSVNSPYSYVFSSVATLVPLITASLGTVLTLTSAFLYLFVCLKLRTRAANLAGRSDMHKLQLRSSVIVLLNTLCWIPVTVLHWVTLSDEVSVANVNWSNDSTAASVLLISISPAVNPLIYTFTGKNFLHSIRKYWRRLKCDISLRRNPNYLDDNIRGVERCSCIPCVRCVHRDEENDPDYWHTQDSSDWNSEQSRLLQSTSE